MSLAALHIDPIAPVLFWVTLIFFLGLLGRYAAQRFHQPGVLGELLMGVFLGNVCYWMAVPQMTVLRDASTILAMTSTSSLSNTEHLYVAYVLDAFSRYGVIFLLFMVGLESSVSEIKETGGASLKVAVIGVVVPMLLGFLVTYGLLPDATFKINLFVGATLSATSVGITARVLKEMNKMRIREAKTILGAAVIDDILGLLLLAVVSTLVVQGVIHGIMAVLLLLKAGLFFASVFLMGPWLLRQSVRFFEFLDCWEAKWVTSFLFMMLCSWLVTQAQLAAIIGAFVAGLVIHDGFFEKNRTSRSASLTIRELIAPLESLFAPLFFMLVGIQVKLETWTNPHVLILASALTIAAIVGKLVSGFGAPSKDDRLLIGIGMLPRGEVGLVFASIGRTLGVISDELFSAIIIMVMMTTFVAPIGLAWRFKHRKKEIA